MIIWIITVIIDVENHFLKPIGCILYNKDRSGLILFPRGKTLDTYEIKWHFQECQILSLRVDDSSPSIALSELLFINFSILDEDIFNLS